MGELESTLVLDALPGAIVAVDRDDRVTVWNRGAEHLFGWTSAETLGRPLRIVPPDLVAQRDDWMRQAAAGDELEVTTQRLHRDGHRVDVVLQFAAISGIEGDHVGTAVLCRDASSQLRTASRLQRSQTELALVRRLASLAQRVLQDLDLPGVLQAIVEVAVDLVDADAGVLSMERAPGVFARVTNVNIPPDLTHHPILPGEGLHGVVLETGRPVALDDYSSWDGAIPPFLGRDFHAAVAVPISDDHHVLGVLSVHATDPSRRFGPEEIEVVVLFAEYAALAIGNARAYRQVSTERERFLALVEAVPAGLAVVENGVVTAWNVAAAALTGRSAEEVIGAPPPIDLENAARGAELQVGEGRVRFLEVVPSDLPGERGTAYLIQDLTEQRDLERAKDLFFATTSHELKTPLTVVKGLATTLLRHWDRMSDDQRVDALETIERRAENLDRLIERILVGSRVQAGAYDIIPTPVEVGRLIEEIVPGFAAASPDHVVTAQVSDPPLPLVAGDRQVIDTILGHLLENAIKYSPAGGEVTVCAAAEDGGRRVVIAVRDQGIGIDGDIDRLLRPFVQADSRTTRRFGGVGLGLYIVRKLTDALGAELSARNIDGGGSEFSVAFPLWH